MKKFGNEQDVSYSSGGAVWCRAGMSAAVAQQETAPPPPPDQQQQGPPPNGQMQGPAVTDGSGAAGGADAAAVEFE